ncbi:Hypp3563 [Branchiostoma lanceolatum]|uniref:Hypp3563 protein n=1 Tax=Branchiostoma lanceolatum TaxID=7740 RepID=A0A8K0A069_BRALA|nr:Hypp3563 [Branchiostoma lanceolatum]
MELPQVSYLPKATIYTPHLDVGQPLQRALHVPEAQCSEPPVNPGTRKVCSRPYIHGETCAYRCLDGYTRVSDGSVTCSDGVWIGTPITCNIVDETR